PSQASPGWVVSLRGSKSSLSRPKRHECVRVCSKPVMGLLYAAHLSLKTQGCQGRPELKEELSMILEPKELPSLSVGNLPADHSLHATPDPVLLPDSKSFKLEHIERAIARPSG